MPGDRVTRQTNQKSSQDELLSWVNSFLSDRRAQGLTSGSIRYYRQKLEQFAGYAQAHDITSVEDITPDALRAYLLHLSDTGHNAGGCHSFYRSLKAFLRFYESEAEPEDWTNPVRKVKAPRTDEEVLAPVELPTVQAMVDACPGKTFTGLRDRALLWFLLDTGVRAKECLALDIADIDAGGGAALIRHSKARRPRTVYFGKRARQAYRAYLKRRGEEPGAAWLTIHGEPLQYDGLRAILTERAKKAGVPRPTAHSFRRAYALAMLRSGCDLITLARLMGHKGLSVLQKYLRQLPDDLKAAHAKGGPVDHMRKGGEADDTDR